MTGERVYMLAADHRWQWERFCDENGVSRQRIGDVKALIVDAFLAARDRSTAVAQYGSMLLDPQYASAQIARATAAGVAVGTPAEKAGAFPLAWPSDDPFASEPAGAFVKVLVKDRTDYEPALRDGQFARLLLLQQWCRAHRVPLLVEVLVPQGDDGEDTFERTGRPAMLAQSIRDAYARGIEPSFWKVEGTTNAAGAAVVEAAIAESPSCRQIILGKDADPQLIARWFATAATCRTAVGFAIGRSVFWKPGAAFLIGSMDARSAVDAMAATYLSLIDLWQAAVPVSPVR
jgi:myo-inositol catabolism protein IolC